MRYAAALSTVKGCVLEVENIRINRSNPGLRAQHLCLLKSLCTLCNGSLKGGTVGSKNVVFHPGCVCPGSYSFEVGTAGSMTLILQALLLSCVGSPGKYVFELSGGSDVSWSPGWDYFCNVFVVLLRRMGIGIDCELLKRGYYPQGGGKIRLTCFFPERLTSLQLPGSQKYNRVEGIIHGCGLNDSVFTRLSHSIKQKAVGCGFSSDLKIEKSKAESIGIGASLWSYGSLDGVVGISVLGKKGVASEKIGNDAMTSLAMEMKSKVSIDMHCFDQILPFLVIASGESKVVIRSLSSHAKSAVWLVEKFFGKFVKSTQIDNNQILVVISGQ